MELLLAAPSPHFSILIYSSSFTFLLSFARVSSFPSRLSKRLCFPFFHFHPIFILSLSLSLSFSLSLSEAKAIFRSTRYCSCVGEQKVNKIRKKTAHRMKIRYGNSALISSYTLTAPHLFRNWWQQRPVLTAMPEASGHFLKFHVLLHWK